MTLRRSHTAKMERSPTVFPSAKMSTFEDAPSAEKRKILDEADKISKEERAKLTKRGDGIFSSHACTAHGWPHPPTRSFGGMAHRTA